jgi:hypothetical protein
MFIETGRMTVGPDLPRFGDGAPTTPILETPFRIEASIYTVGPLYTTLSAWIASSGELVISMSS